VILSGRIAVIVAPPFLATFPLGQRDRCALMAPCGPIPRAIVRLEDTEGLKVKVSPGQSFVVRGCWRRALSRRCSWRAFNPSSRRLSSRTPFLPAGPFLRRQPERSRRCWPPHRAARTVRGRRVSGQWYRDLRASCVCPSMSWRLADALGTPTCSYQSRPCRLGSSTSDRVALAHAHESMMHHLSTSHQRAVCFRTLRARSRREARVADVHGADQRPVGHMRGVAEEGRPR
jgi:hypothetical protein